MTFFLRNDEEMSNKVGVEHQLLKSFEKNHLIFDGSKMFETAEL